MEIGNIVSSILSLRKIMSNQPNFQRSKALEFTSAMYDVLSILDESVGGTREFEELKNSVLLAKSIATAGGVTKEKAIESFDVALLQILKVVKNMNYFADDSFSRELDLLGNLPQPHDERLTQPMILPEMPPSAIISISELKKEKCFVSGYKAKKDGILVFVALCRGAPSWDGKRVVQYVTLEMGTYLELRLVFQEISSLSSRLSVAWFDAHEHQRLMLLKYENLRKELLRATAVISQYEKILFRAHTNLVGIEPCWLGADQYGSVVIRFIVVCKNYIPEGEEQLPTRLCAYSTRVRQGWFQFTAGTGGLEIQSCLKPGCAVSPEQTSGRGEGSLSTFGTVGGYVTVKDKSYAVTVGHLFTPSPLMTDTYPVGTSVVVNPKLAQLWRRCVNNQCDQAKISSIYDIYGSVDAYKKMLSYGQWSTEDETNAVAAIQSAGTLVGCLVGVTASNDKLVDVALIEVDHAAVHFDGNGCLSFQTDSVPIPTLEIALDEQYRAMGVVLLDEESAIGREAHGYGAFSSEDIEVSICHNCTVFIADRIHGKSYQCFRGTPKIPTSFMRPGDSGTWFWCSDGSLVGMGIGTENHDALILPMTDVVVGIKDILLNHCVHSTSGA